MATKRDRKKEFEILMETSPLGIVLTDMQNKFLYVNPSFRKMLGYTEKEILSMNIMDLTHPDSFNVSKKAIEKAFHEKRTVALEKQYIHKNGHRVDARVRIAAVFDEKGNALYQCTNIENITERKQADQQLIYQATHDDLTELINRREFERRADYLVKTAKLKKNEHALCFMDLDQFKVVNDTCGHTAGDELLRQLSMVLKNTLRKRDTLARLGGDEFGILMEHCSLDDAHKIATTILKETQDFQFAWEGKRFKVGVSMGLVSITETTIDLSTVLRDADAACYTAKDMGRNRIHTYHADDSELVKRHGEMQWVVHINKALDEDKLCLYAQAIVPIDGSKSTHYEVLVRMMDDEGKIIPPGSFLPAAERYNLISKLDRWVVDATFSYLLDNPVFLNKINFCSINLSGQSLAEPSFLKFMVTQFHKFGIAGEKICFEITETAAISNLSTAIKFISTLKGLGCLFALDDFGSGLSSFGYLKNLPVDYLKIDGIFVKDIVDDPIDRAMVKSINEIGHVMGMKTIAEFVENEQVKEMLREIGVNYAQGYGIGKPIPISDFMLKTRSN